MLQGSLDGEYSAAMNWPVTPSGEFINQYGHFIVWNIPYCESRLGLLLLELCHRRWWVTISMAEETTLTVIGEK